MHQKAVQLNCRFMEGAVTPAPLEPTTATLYTPAMITPATFKFLRDLKKHNQRAWFHEHRERYLAARAEMVGLVEACLTEIAHIRTEHPGTGPRGLPVPHQPRHALLQGKDALQDALRGVHHGPRPQDESRRVLHPR
jgi:hypothetical protein